jgi:hypothetical protein
MFWIIVGLLVAGFVIYKLRVPIIARVLGQPESRIDRHLNRRRKELP